MDGIPDGKTHDRVLVIAEAGVNHNGSVTLAKELIEVASLAGADIVKFQTFDSRMLTTGWSPVAPYQEAFVGRETTQQSMLEGLELSDSEFQDLYDACRRYGIEFLSTAFETRSLDLLTKIGIKRIKLPSGEITNLDLLEHAASKNLPIILSTGMSTMDEVGQAIQVLTNAGHDKSRLTVLHCTSAYPTPLADVNLSAMKAIGNTYEVDIGYSDHTAGLEVSVGAVALGARIIEKHVTLSRQMIGPDHQSSLEPDEFRELVQQIRNIEIALGDEKKVCTPSERRVREVARRSIVAARPISAGEEITREMICFKRPGTGLSPMRYREIIGAIANRSFQVDEMLDL